MGLDTQLTISRFELLAKTGKARLNGEVIEGTFGDSPLIVRNTARICEEIANCPDSPEAILRFTLKYAPLETPTKSGEKFQFELCEWRAFRKTFRNNWQSVFTVIRGWDRSAKMWSFPKGSRLIFSPTGNTLQQDRFLDLVNLCFGALPWERVRICPAPGCEKPYFVAAHLKQVYCGDRVCVAWGKRKLKLEYWNRNKERFMKERKLNRKERLDGSNKAR